MSDFYGTYTSELTAPASANFDIIPSDTTDLEHIPRSVYVGVGGHVVIVGREDTNDTGVTFQNVPAGSIIPVRARRILATGTTAAGLIGLGYK